ncbi:transforming acidic coiled-coil-containing protein 1-like isoform X1 [Chrysoperla carnea]|uniref:transforming acidic coiled-coil-containing protein 1-like isoform X1 n=1 Tax=Chrysoperla carnea TaxID=189513 RepID=UPI001D0801A9|nr:transforming acidic coiled-coil-containing protein 1-like isoform X1 [Chrysoperla carnea]XP_044741088.1 transforming acidic coiled-coil-containing protein 1-like isoform X1 [Chrysoperla carnea]XP_044741089.1 transforming acidic coiled-coil-containing protein 1-like isoform X1 [Chrysoperla carnea]XP_044741090.1 transforming acidic coiled-coil-containing protein 1-like isoform X1 [Chrysoperla carnea]XP_044741091.1 transforming acidic coiled-coil-containing protein 1-like isoform X1 [Chrysoperl
MTLSEVDDKKKSTAEEKLAEVLESANALVKTISKRDDVDPNTAIMARQLLSSVMELKDLPSTNTRADENLVQQAIAAKKNEEKLNVVISEYEKTIAKLIRDNACIAKERDKANDELIEMKKKYEDEILRLEAIIKTLELKNSSLQSVVDQRNKDCKELASICDELIAKVERKN